MRLRLALIVAVSTTGAACGDTGSTGDDAEPDAGTCGEVRGQRDGDVWSWLGIPYAAAPVGALRFAPPAPATCEPDGLDADELGPRCPQLDEDGALVGDEDCLFLNVWAQDGAEDLPVMVWIHGGGNAVGSASDPLYDGAALAGAGDVVVVTINYRLGQLGYLAHPDLGAGNYGLLDQVAALTWVRDHIAGFGGDPDTVTIFGESAGGRNVCTLLAMPSAEGLFDRAIIQSGACKFLETLAQAEDQGAAVAAELGCGADVAACVRAASVSEIIHALPAEISALSGGNYNPVVDGEVVPEQPEDAIVAGRSAQVPLLVGATADETSTAAPLTMSQATYEGLIRASFGTALGDQVLAEYAAVSPPRAAYVRATSDARFICPSREIARSASALPSRRYFFRYAPSAYGAPHGIEIPYLFATFSAVIANGQPYVPTATDRSVSSTIQSAWAEFARTGAVASWPVWDATDPALVFDATTAVELAPGASHCDFWRPLYESL